MSELTEATTQVVTRMSGKVKWFDCKKGFGFIDAADGEGDVFVHYKDIPGEGYRSLAEDQEVEFDMIETEKGAQAKNVKLIGETPVKKTGNPILDEKSFTVKVNVKQIRLLSKNHGIPFDKLVKDIFELGANEFLAECK